MVVVNVSQYACELGQQQGRDNRSRGRGRPGGRGRQNRENAVYGFDALNPSEQDYYSDLAIQQV